MSFGDRVVEVPCQRWRQRKAEYRSIGDAFDPSRYRVVEMRRDTEAKAFILQHHYLGSYPAALRRYALLERGALQHHLVGVSVFAEPAQKRTIPCYAPGLREGEGGLLLSRFVLDHEVPGNAESWFLGQIWRALRGDGVRAVVSYSDPMPRAATTGEVVTPGHIGVIYQAHNGRYLGRNKPETVHLDRNGRGISRIALDKIRYDRVGRAYSERQLLEAGCPARLPGEHGRDYVERALAAGVESGALRRVRPKKGNHVYGWALTRRDVLKPSAGTYPHELDRMAA